MATIQDDDEEEGEVMLTIMPNEDGEMVAVPIHVRNEDDDASKSMSLVESVDNADSHVSWNLRKEMYLNINWKWFEFFRKVK